MSDSYRLPPELVLGTRLNCRVPKTDQIRQRAEAEDILRRLRNQPGVILADEVGMGKTYVALAIAYSVAVQSPRGPVIVMVPATLIGKWEQDLKAFCQLYLEDRHPVRLGAATNEGSTGTTTIRYGVARHSIELMKLLDDPPRKRCHLIFLAQGAMARSQSDKWVRLALIAEALRRHGRGGAARLIEVKKYIHRYLAELLWAIGEERATKWGEELWQSLLRTAPDVWKDTYNASVRDETRKLSDDPVPKSVIRALDDMDLAPLAEALKQMPVRASGDDKRMKERLDIARTALRLIEGELWKTLLAQVRWRSPLLVMDEAHHLKNPGTALARQLQSPDLQQDLRTGDGAMARAFDRMLFLTATPFQLGHRELVSVLRRFGDVRWSAAELGDQATFTGRLDALSRQLDNSQRTAIGLKRAWKRLRPEDHNGDAEAWWTQLVLSPRESLSHYQRAVLEAFDAAKRCRDATEESLRPWIVRHNKGRLWEGTKISRRSRLDGASMSGQSAPGGLPIPPQQLLPFFLAARSAVKPGDDLLGEALCSSYEAFRLTRQNREVGKDEEDLGRKAVVELSHSGWYLAEFDRALERCSGSAHPKVDTTIRKVVDLWEAGEKVLVFAYYLRTCRALRIHISNEIERRIILAAQGRIRETGRDLSPEEIEKAIDKAQTRYFDVLDSPGRRALDAALLEIIEARTRMIGKAKLSEGQSARLLEVMRRFLRVPTTLARCFPLGELDEVQPEDAVRRTIDYVDGSGASWRGKFDGFVDFLIDQCATEDEREAYLEAARRTQTGGIRVEGEAESDDADAGTTTLANVQVVTGATSRETKARLMMAFNTPFFPDVLVCSEVMGEGVDLQRFCRHVIHHDLAWNPSDIEQRTGRIDRLGCKAEGRHPIVVYLPYLSGAADERQYQVMSEREQWFRVVMGQDEVARLITTDTEIAIPVPAAVSDGLSFELGVSKESVGCG